MSDNIVFLSYEQAVSLLPDGDDVHVFLNPNGMLVGADWSRQSVLDMLKVGTSQLGGDMCLRMGHGLVCENKERFHFVATRPQEQWSADLQQPTEQSTPAVEAGMQS
jgi:hypothetical protein